MAFFDLFRSCASGQKAHALKGAQRLACDACPWLVAQGAAAEVARGLRAKKGAHVYVCICA